MTMINPSLYNDFINYVNENHQLITYLDESQSVLNDYVGPIIKALYYLNKISEEDEDVNKEIEDVFQFGVNYLFENIEQIKLYLRQLNNDYQLLDKMAFYIKVVFDLEELKLEIDKVSDIDQDEKERDIKIIDEILEFFEENIVPDVTFNELELDNYLSSYYDMIDKYRDIPLTAEAFMEYCASYGI